MALNFSGVKVKKHLAFNKSSSVKPISTSDLYILSGMKTNAACYIGAHGAAMDNNTFVVPSGLTIRFTQPHGYTMSMPMSRLRHSKPVVDQSGWGQVEYTAGQNCPNYFLTKWHGRHSNIADYASAEEDYAGWQSIIESNPSLAFAFPRNRWNKTGIPLSAAIKTVQSKLGWVNEIWCLFCRYDSAIEPWNWDANTGTWTLVETDEHGTSHHYTWDFSTDSKVPL
ncbi:MAG: putative adhesin [Pseudomonadota bacterium]